MPLALVALLCLAPQDDPVLAGRVLDAAGKPVAEATVTLLARPIARHVDPAHEHRVVVETDARGGFRAPLHADGVYSVWAATATAATAIAEGESAPGFVELRLAPDTGPSSVAVTGVEAWPEAATFGYRAVVGGENLDFVPVALHDGALALPPLPPFAFRPIDIVTADGRLLWTGVRPNAGIAMPPPATWTVHVTNDHNAPLAGVEVLALLPTAKATESKGVPDRERDRNAWANQGQTDANGALTIRIAGAPMLFSRKDGYMSSLDGRSGTCSVRAGTLTRVDAPTYAGPVDVVLRAAPALAVPLLRNDAPLAVDTLFVTANMRTKLADGSGSAAHSFDFAFPIRNGIATMPAFPADTVFVAAATTLAPEARELWRQRFGFAPPSALRLPHPTTLPHHPPLDGEGWHSLIVTASDGRPAANTLVSLHTSSASDGALLRTNRAGRLLFEAQQTVRIAAYAPAGMGAIDVPAACKEARLVLRPTQLARVRAVGADGKPIVGVIFAMHFPKAVGADDEMRDYLQFVQGQRPRSDADGNFEVLMPAFQASVRFIAPLSGKAAQQIDVEWTPARPADIVLTVPQQ